MKLQIIFLLFNIVTEFETIQKNDLTRSQFIQKEENRSKWSQRIIRAIKKVPKIYQIILITNCENFQPIGIIQNLQKNVPTIYFDELYTKREIQHLEKWNSLKNPRDTTLFMIIESPAKNNTHSLEEIMSLIKKLSTVRSRPKCLILCFSNSNGSLDYKNFLQKMWQDLFLDITILDVIKGQFKIHQLNPFVSYKSKSFSKETQLFPNKLENLNGYPIRIGIFNREPFITLKRNSTNYPINISGPDAEAGKFFAKVLNYRQILIPSNKEGFGNLHCNIDKLSGFMAALQQNKIQLISITTSSLRTVCKKEIYENAIFNLDHYIAIIPTLKSKNFSINIGNSFYYSILLTVIITIASWIIVKIFNFDRIIWNWMMIIQILFGVSVMNEPSKLMERIIFGCLLIMNFYYSCNIFEGLTDFNFRMEKEREINTLNDLIKSGLQLCSEKNVIAILPSIINQNDFKVWLKNSRFLTPEECIEFLLNYKNVTCIMKMSLAEWYAGFYKEQNLVKFVPEFIVSVGIGFLFEPGSPYVEKYQQIHRSLMEFALLEKWQMKKLPNATRYHQLSINLEKNLQTSDNSNDEWKAESLLIGILIAGYLISILSFVVELAFSKWKQRQSRIN